MVMTAANSPETNSGFVRCMSGAAHSRENRSGGLYLLRCGGSGGRPAALRDMARIKRQGFAHLPICIAKTCIRYRQPQATGSAEGFTIGVRRVLLNAGAGFLVVLTGNIMRMPGLPKAPAAQEMDVVDDRIVNYSTGWSLRLLSRRPQAPPGNVWTGMVLVVVAEMVTSEQREGGNSKRGSQMTGPAILPWPMGHPGPNREQLECAEYQWEAQNRTAWVAGTPSTVVISPKQAPIHTN